MGSWSDAALTRLHGLAKRQDGHVDGGCVQQLRHRLWRGRRLGRRGRRRRCGWRRRCGRRRGVGVGLLKARQLFLEGGRFGLGLGRSLRQLALAELSELERLLLRADGDVQVLVLAL